jgi:outer membrane lipoprotein carrier protein
MMRSVIARPVRAVAIHARRLPRVLRTLAMTLSLAMTSLFAMTTIAHASPIDRMIESIASTQTLTADFSQTTAAKSARVRTSSGSFWISKPGLLRWEVKKPYPQIQVLNETEFWSYDIDLQQASVRPVASAQLTGIAALLLSTNSLSRAALNQRYEFSEDGASNGLSWVRVVPKEPEPGISKLRVAIDRDSLLSEFEIHDALGQVTQVKISNIQKNIAVDPGLFLFVPPKGVSVLRAP